MAKKISSSDLFEQEDLFKGVRDSATKTLAVFNELQAELKATAQGLKNELTANTQASTAQLKQFTAVSEEANKLMKQSVEIEKLKAQADQQRIKAEAELVKLQKAQAQEAARLAKEQEKTAKNAQNEVSAYSKLSAELNKARKAYKDLAVTNQTNTQEAKDLLNTITKLDKQLKEVDATVGQHQRNVGNYEGATRNLKMEFRQLVRELQNLEQTDPRFQEMTQRAAELKDQIDDTNATIKATAGNAVENLAGGFVTTAQLGVAGFQGVEASMALMGVESENVQKSLMRLTALMNLSDSLKTLGEIDQKFVEIKASITAFGAKASGAFKQLTAAGKAFAVTGIGLIVTGLGYAISKFSELSDEGKAWQEMEEDRLAQKKELIEKQKAENQEIATQTANFVGLVAQLKQTNQNSKERKNLIDQINSQYGTTLKNMASEIDFQAQLNQAVADYITFQTLKIRQKQNEEKITKIIEKQIELANKARTTLGIPIDDPYKEFDFDKFLKGQTAVEQSTLNSLKLQGSFGEQQIETYRDLQTEVMNLGLELNDLGMSGLDLNKELGKYNYRVKQTTQSTRNLGTATKQVTTMNDALKAYYEAIERDRISRITNAQEKEIQDVMTQYETLFDLADKAGKDTKDLKEQELKDINAIIQKYKDQEKQLYIDAQAEIDRATIRNANELADIIEGLQEDNYNATLTQTQREIRAINDKYFELEEKAKGNAEQLKIIAEAKARELAEVNKKYGEALNKNFELSKQYAQQTTDFFKKQSDERIALIDKEISAAEKQAEVYRELAANGNINAEQSLAEQERIIAESNQRKEREMKRQQRMELANTIYQTYAGHAAQDPKTALANTIRDASLLQAFISTLPMFYDGTEDTGAGGGVDGKGGFHAVLHPHERVIPKSLNDQIGSLTNEQLTRLATDYQNGRLIGKDTAHNSLELALLVNKLDTLTEVIKHKPETNIQLGEITQSAMEIVQSTKQGNTTVYNRFKVRK